MEKSINYTFRLEVVSDPDTPYEKKLERNYTNALEAVNAYNSYVDYGMAAYERFITMIEPNGQVHSKSFSTRGASFADKVIRYQIS